MERIKQILPIALTVLLVASMTGCRHRGHRGSRGERERISRNCSDDDRPSRSRSTRNDGRNAFSGTSLSAEQISEVAEGDDYDAMLDCLSSAIKEFRQLRKAYFGGNMPDKEAEERMKEIEARYQPVMTKLEQASSEGLLTYNQHRKQMQLAGEFLKEFTQVMNKLEGDAIDALR